MQTVKKLNLLHLLLFTLDLFCSGCIAQQTPTTSFCGKIRIQSPFMVGDLTEPSSPLHRMVLCKSQKLYFRTSIGLFPISSIDYTGRTLTISDHPFSCSSSLHFVSPLHLSAGFPSPPQTNSLLLFNCSNQKYSMPTFIRNCTGSHGCGAQFQEQGLEGTHSCLLADDAEKLDMSFHPKVFNCSHYSRVFRRSLNEKNEEGYELGTRISFEIPDHVPNICDECQKSNGNCGVGLKCICHPKECKDKVIYASESLKLSGNIFLSSVSFIILVIGFLMKEM